MNPYQLLANAIVELAVKDYKAALKQHHNAHQADNHIGFGNGALLSNNLLEVDNIVEEAAAAQSHENPIVPRYIFLFVVFFAGREQQKYHYNKEGYERSLLYLARQQPNGVVQNAVDHKCNAQ